MIKALCTECSGRGCKDCGGLGVLVCERQPESQEPPTFAEYYHDEIERAGYIRLAADEVVVNVNYLLSLANAFCKDTCQACDGDAECAQCWVEMLRQESTAAIDAASKEARRDE
jgi:hypothetical protein